MVDVVIENGFIVDGTGAPPFAGTRARGGRAAADRPRAESPVRRGCRASGRDRPGGDARHRGPAHPLGRVAAVRAACVSAIGQGVTTQVVGLCGFSAAPISDETLAGMIDEEPVFAFPGVAWDWRSFDGYLDAVDAAGPATNVVSLVGHTTLRRYVMGTDDAAAHRRRAGADAGRAARRPRARAPAASPRGSRTRPACSRRPRRSRRSRASRPRPGGRTTRTCATASAGRPRGRGGGHHDGRGARAWSSTSRTSTRGRGTRRTSRSATSSASRRRAPRGAAGDVRHDRVPARRRGVAPERAARGRGTAACPRPWRASGPASRGAGSRTSCARTRSGPPTGTTS